MSEPSALDPEDAKLVTLARAARARNGAAEGAAVRDDTGRTYVATTVALASVSLSALQAAVVLAATSGASALEAAVVVTAATSVDDEGRRAVADLSPGVSIVVADARGAVMAVLSAGG